jgi:phage shock protein B
MNAGHIVAIVAIVFGCLTAMVGMIIRAIAGGGRREKGARGDGTQLGQRELFDLAMRLQSRVETLERLLDSTQPEWRGKS